MALIEENRSEAINNPLEVFVPAAEIPPEVERSLDTVQIVRCHRENGLWFEVCPFDGSIDWSVV